MRNIRKKIVIRKPDFKSLFSKISKSEGGSSEEKRESRRFGKLLLDIKIENLLSKFLYNEYFQYFSSFSALSWIEKDSKILNPCSKKFFVAPFCLESIEERRRRREIKKEKKRNNI